MPTKYPYADFFPHMYNRNNNSSHLKGYLKMKEYMKKHLNSLHIVNNKQFCSPKAYCHYNKTTKLSVQAFSERIQIGKH